MTQEKTYVGELIRKEIRYQRLTNGYVIHKMKVAGIEMSDAKFSNKLYGERDQFTIEEVTVANDALGTNFQL